MTKEEALKLLGESQIRGVALKDSKLPLAEAVDMAIVALGKQIPKPPKQDYDEAKNLTYYTCPTCGEDVITFIPENRMTIKEHHCRCGQAILWSEE